MTNVEIILKDVARRCAAFRTLRTARAISRVFDDALRPCGITSTQFSLLIAIGHEEPLTMTALGDVLSMDRTTVSRNLKLLEESGLVSRRTEGEKRRRIALTPDGVTKLEEAYAAWAGAQGKIETALGTEHLAAAMKALSALRRAAEG